MKIIVAAGGTAGHINPALSLCQEFSSRDKNNEILFIGTKDRMESDLVPRAGFNYKGIAATGLSRSFTPSGILHNAKALIQTVRSSSDCKKIIKEFSPDAVVGFGGYVSGPVVAAAQSLGIKTAIHEQNAFPGKTNIALAKKADAVMITSPDAAGRLKCRNQPITTGLPVRAEILDSSRAAARKKLGIDEDKKVVLITGGSLGAAAINDAMPEVYRYFSGNDSLLFVHGYGKLNADFPEKLSASGIDREKLSNAIINEYIYNMGDYMAACDLMICRAGASTIAEISVMGRAALLVPYPYATENHQYYNALSLSKNNAAILTEQKDFNSQTVISAVNRLISDPDFYKEIAENAKKTAITDAAVRICDIVISLNG